LKIQTKLLRQVLKPRSPPKENDEKKKKIVGRNNRAYTNNIKDRVGGKALGGSSPPASLAIRHRARNLLTATQQDPPSDNTYHTGAKGNKLCTKWKPRASPGQRGGQKSWAMPRKRKPATKDGQQRGTLDGVPNRKGDM